MPEFKSFGGGFAQGFAGGSAAVNDAIRTRQMGQDLDQKREQAKREAGEAAFQTTVKVFEQFSNGLDELLPEQQAQALAEGTATREQLNNATELMRKADKARGGDGTIADQLVGALRIPSLGTTPFEGASPAGKITQDRAAIEASGGDVDAFDEEVVAGRAPKPQKVQQLETALTIAEENGNERLAKFLKRELEQETAIVGRTPQDVRLGGKGLEEDLNQAEIATITVVGEIGRLKTQLTDKDTLTSAVAAGASAINQIAGNLQQAASLLGNDDSQVLDSSQYNFTTLGEEAAKSGAFRSNITNLAYSLARAAEPGGRLSKEDVQLQIDRLGAGKGDKAVMASILDEVSEATKRAFKVRHEVMGRVAAQQGVTLRPFPAELEPGKAKSKAKGKASSKEPLSATGLPEGRRATSPDGKKWIVRNGKWVPG